MIPRKPLAPNNRAPISRARDFRVSRLFYVKSQERPSVYVHLRAGRSAQANGASGGGKVVGK
jgi:hypothetical protein